MSELANTPEPMAHYINTGAVSEHTSSAEKRRREAGSNILEDEPAIHQAKRLKMYGEANLAIEQESQHEDSSISENGDISEDSDISEGSNIWEDSDTPEASDTASAEDTSPDHSILALIIAWAVSHHETWYFVDSAALEANNVPVFGLGDFDKFIICLEIGTTCFLAQVNPVSGTVSVLQSTKYNQDFRDAKAQIAEFISTHLVGHKYQEPEDVWTDWNIATLPCANRDAAANHGAAHDYDMVCAVTTAFRLACDIDLKTPIDESLARRFLPLFIGLSAEVSIAAREDSSCLEFDAKEMSWNMLESVRSWISWVRDAKNAGVFFQPFLDAVNNSGLSMLDALETR
ncbi:hypothetical protein B0T26DRAFT_679708 [Lasiosphaeria miniovina]|uniref:Uncharacterized protein n=1 Tax=Lasiosphaeria miniovina TaxID=1954250 RepID=A0AA39ZYF7_9PEZI|nr:uncharacterized protein B0T26DRAFT_679708 [Lasiosphaeria miniovina]KAK0705942.1 hypothetical protein B0T26DRAFT_679708 [Lasiosphaeria miniovina]